MMRKLYEFHGGIVIKDDHKIADSSTITQIQDPKIFVIPLKEHIGNAPKPVVNIGAKVKKYELLAKARVGLSSSVHAPASGEIIAIKTNPVIHPGGLNDLCIFLKNDGKNTKPREYDRRSFLSFDQEEIFRRIRELGVVGLGGAGFPSYAKIKSTAINYLIINGAECEPYISCDDALMQNYALEIITGIKAVQRLLDPKHTVIAVENNKPKAIRTLQKALDNHDYNSNKIELVAIPTKYPSGGEKQLIKIITNRNVSKKQVPEDIVCYNVNTMYSIYNAVEQHIPLVERIVTITGNACSLPGNYLIKIGTPVEHIIKHCQIKNYVQLINGGPLMGFAFDPMNTSITKLNSCIIAADHTEVLQSQEETECIRCGKCAEVCPMQLLPQQLYWYNNELKKAEFYDIENCIECACCDYVCPSNIPLSQYFNATKLEIYQKNQQKTKSLRAKKRHEQREARLKRLEQERKERLAKQRAAIKKKVTQKKLNDKEAIIAAAKKRLNHSSSSNNHEQ